MTHLVNEECGHPNPASSLVLDPSPFGLLPLGVGSPLLLWLPPGGALGAAPSLHPSSDLPPALWLQLRGFPERWKERGQEGHDRHHRWGVPRQPRPGEGDPAKRARQRDQIRCGRESCPSCPTLRDPRGLAIKPLGSPRDIL